MFARMSGFESLGLAEWLLRQVSAMGFKEPTPVQAHCIPPILEGKTRNYLWLQSPLCFSPHQTNLLCSVYTKNVVDVSF